MSFYPSENEQYRQAARLRDASSSLCAIEDGLNYWSSMVHSMVDGAIRNGRPPYGSRELYREAADDFEGYAKAFRTMARR